jgi:aspartate aminotransferase-like enzyme
VDFEHYEQINFRLPGPTPLPPTVRAALARPAIHHRGPLLKTIMRSVTQRLKEVHRTEGDVLIWPGSGSAGWEIAITNLLSPGDRVVVTTCGDFGDRMARAATRLGLEVMRVDRTWGQAVLPEHLAEALARTPGAKAVMITHNETSTGVVNPLADLARVARDAGCLVIVDAVSSASAVPLEVDAWGLDFVISGSQKAWMCPPGLVICAIGERCWQAYEQSTYRRFFWDIAAARSSSQDGMTPTTPPLPLIFALDAALDLMMSEGIEVIWARHARLGALARRRVVQAGLTLFAAPDCVSDTLTAIAMPDGWSSRTVIDHLVEHENVMLQGGQGAYAESVLRIGHMGWVTEAELSEALDALERGVTALAMPLTAPLIS